MVSQTTLERLYAEKLAYIDGSLSRFDADLKRLQRELFDFLIQDFATRLQVEGGVIVQNQANARLLLELDKYMTTFKQTFANQTFAKLGESMLKMTDLTTSYYRAMVGGGKTIDKIAKRLDAFRAFVGVDKNGAVLEGSFIDHLADGNQLRTALSQYVQNSITGQSDYRSFVKGFRDIIQGSDEVNGAYERYVGGYAKDAFFQQARTQENFFGEQLGLDYFVYDGELVKDSRPFCIEHHGKTYPREILEQWDGETWQGKIPDVPVEQQVGGYNCRHILRWIPSEYGEENIADQESDES